MLGPKNVFLRNLKEELNDNVKFLRNLEERLINNVNSINKLKEGLYRVEVGGGSNKVFKTIL